MRLRYPLSRLLWFFPILMVGNFLVMAIGLAFDNRGVGTPEELPHRPFVVMYFAVMAWTGGAAGWWLLQSRRLRNVAPLVLALTTIALLLVPAAWGSGVQRIWAMPGGAHLRISPGLYRATQYMRDHSKPQDIFQDSKFDSNYISAALSELRPYVEHMMVRVSYNAHWVDERTAVITNFMAMSDPTAVRDTARRLGVRWFLLHPGHPVAWPAAIVGAPVFEYGGFRVYRFD
jgi:hypothetical protein